MKRTALVTLLFGIALLLAPAAQAHWMSDDSGNGSSVVLSDSSNSGSGVVLHTDTLGGSGTSGVVLRPDILGGDGNSGPVPIRADVLGGDGRPSDTVVWLDRQLRNDRAIDALPTVSADDSFAYGDAAVGAALVAAMLLALGTVTVTRRRHRLSF